MSREPSRWLPAGRRQPPFGGPLGPPCPHVASACLKAGEFGLIVEASGNISPPCTIAFVFGEGDDVTGSGKFVTPWARMHLAYVSAAVRSAAVGPGCAALALRMLMHPFLRGLECGDCLSMAPHANPPLGRGSAKFGMPWARMHCANARLVPVPVPVLVPLELALDPHAKSATAQATAAARRA
jgi:hypothetical protein